MSVKISPSILTADFTRLGEQVKEIADQGIKYLHIDVMDGRFVPNLTIGPLIVSALKPLAKQMGLILDVHLMIEQPEHLIPAFANAGANIITVHAETCPHLNRTIEQIHDLNCQAGVAVNPATPLVFYENIIQDIDVALIMSVNPGFGGQKFIQGSLHKITAMRALLEEKNNHHVKIEVDGGIKATNVGEIVKAGADILVIGSAIFNKLGSVSDNINEIRRNIS